jgi:ATP-binding cassette subfamily B protein
VTGINGAGKTSFIDGLLGLKPLQGYDVTWNDGLRIQNIKDVAYVPQEINLFDGSLLYNITLTQTIHSAHFELFVRKFQLAYFIAGFSFGLNTPIKSSGENISGGQKQMIGILRELYRKPAVLFLDEPSNNLDDSYKSWLYHVLNQINKHVAIICVSHDEQILSMANQQIYLTKAWQTERLKVPL